MEGPKSQEAWMRLNRLEFAPHRIHSLLEAYGGDPAALFAAGRDEWAERLPQMNDKRLNHLAQVRQYDLAKDWESLEKSGAKIVTFPMRSTPQVSASFPMRRQFYSCAANYSRRQIQLGNCRLRRATNYGLTLAHHLRGNDRAWSHCCFRRSTRR